MSLVEKNIPETKALSDFGNGYFTGFYLEAKKVNLEKGQSLIHTFVLETGEVVEIWGFNQLDQLLKGTIRGTLIRLLYNGKVKDNKGREVHNCKAWNDIESKIDLV